MKNERRQTSPSVSAPVVPGGGWLPFAGGELEGQTPRRTCDRCRARASGAGPDTATPLLCFDCHRAERQRARAIRAAGDLNTASEARFQDALPFEPVNRVRLAQLKVERTASRAALQSGFGRFELRRRQALIAVRHALRQSVAVVRARGATKPEEHRAFAMALHAAELQLPDAWLPFVVAR